MDAKRQSDLMGNHESPAEMTGPLPRAYKDPEWFNRRYWDEGLSVADLAKLCGVHPQTVYSWAKAKGYRLRKKTGKPISKETAKKIGEAQRGDKNHQWKGGRVKHTDGYVKVQAPDHPFADGHGYVLEHRLVVEQHLGRYLFPWEVVHHKNHSRSDNRIDNLEVTYRVLHHRAKLICPCCGEDIIAALEKGNSRGASNP